MKKILELEDIKRISLEGLIELKNVCEKYHLKYYLCYGTLLGAVRHKGFIPWDDDIDIVMPRKDYDKLLELSAEIESEKWKLLSSKNNKKFLFVFSKFCNKQTILKPSRFCNHFFYGVSIDIFPLDAVSNSNDREQIKEIQEKLVNEINNQIGKCNIYTGGVAGYSTIKQKIKKQLEYWKSKLLYGNPNTTLMKINEEMSNNYDDSSTFYQSLLTPIPFVIEKDAFGEGMELEFEKEFFNAPSNYDIVLKNIYGDYMTLPKEEERVTHHSFNAYYL